MKIFDRYSLLCVSVALIVLVTVFVNQEEPQNDDIIGIVHEIKETQNGYTFVLDDSNGKHMKCFSRVRPDDHSVCVIKGTLSEDRTIFFVSSLQRVPQNELNRN